MTQYFSDDFNGYSDGYDLNNAAAWLNADLNVLFEIYGGAAFCIGPFSGEQGIRYNTPCDTLTQWAKVTMSHNGGTNTFTGPSVRMWAGAYVEYYGGGVNWSEAYFGCFESGNWTEYGANTNANIQAGDTFELRANGNDLTPYYNDAIDTGVGGTHTDSQFNNSLYAYVGMSGWAATTETDWTGVDNFEGGDYPPSAGGSQLAERSFPRGVLRGVTRGII